MIIKRAKLTVDSVLAGFNKTVEQLRIIARQQDAASKESYEKSLALRDQADNQDAEAARAEAVADKIEALISPTL